MSFEKLSFRRIAIYLHQARVMVAHAVYLTKKLFYGTTTYCCSIMYFDAFYGIPFSFFLQSFLPPFVHGWFSTSLKNDTSLRCQGCNEDR